MDSDGVLRPEPFEILDRRSRQKDHHPLIELLVRWDGQGQDDATWEELHNLREAYPHRVGKVF